MNLGGRKWTIRSTTNFAFDDSGCCDLRIAIDSANESTVLVIDEATWKQGLQPGDDMGCDLMLKLTD